MRVSKAEVFGISPLRTRAFKSSDASNIVEVMELGRLARLSPEKRREFARLGGIARQRKAAADRKALLSG